MKRAISICLFGLLVTCAHATVTDQSFSVSFTCSGTTGPFPFTFPINDPTALTVTQNGTVLSLGVYTVTPVNKNYTNGGSVSLKTVCPVNQILILTRITPLTQTTLFQNNMPLPMTSIMSGLDKLTEISQEQASDIANLSTSGLIDWNNTGVADGYFPVWSAATHKWTAVALTTPGGGLPVTGGTLLGALNGPIINQTYYPVPGTGTISAAITAAGGGNVFIYLQCGTYTDNLHITGSNVLIRGAGVNCTTLQPGSNAAMVNIDAIGGALQYVHISDLTMNNTGGYSGADGIVISGPVNQINDWHRFQDLNIQGFRYGINLVGRTIWTTFEDVHVGASLLSGVYANTAAVLNHIAFRDGQINNSQQYGVYWNNTNTNASLSTEFDHVNVESNGLSGTLANCAGMYLTGVGSMSIHDGYFESNCVTVIDGQGADIRITGTYAQALDIRSNLIWSVTNFGILNDATQTTGTYEGNKITNQTTYAIKTQTTHALSSIHVGSNFLPGNVDYVADGSSDTHVITDGVSPSGTGTPTAGQAACIKTVQAVNGINTLAIGYCSTVISSSGGCTCN